jgi:hypothetical protein
MVYFREEQRLAIWAVLAVLIALPAVAAGVALSRALGGPAAHAGLPYLMIALVAFLMVWISRAKLITEVRGDGLSIRFQRLWPERFIPWSDVRHAESIPLTTNQQGVHWKPGQTTYNAGGGRGVRIELSDGRTVVLGSRKAEQLRVAITGRIQE